MENLTEIITEQLANAEDRAPSVKPVRKGKRQGNPPRKEAGGRRGNLKKQQRKVTPPGSVAPAKKTPVPEWSRPDPISRDWETSGATRSRRNDYSADTEGAIKLYLREIGQVKLLSADEELALAERVKRGDKQARQQMINANLRLVVKIAHDYEGLGLPLLDLINEGNIGLMKAVDRFDPVKGAKLSTYASWWIKQAIKRALANHAKTIRLPVHVMDKVHKIHRTSAKLQEVLGRDPTDEELAEEMEMPASRISRLRTAAVNPASLDAPIGDEQDSHNFSEVVQDDKASTPYQRLEEKTVTHMLQEMVKTLDSRESNILRCRFGLDGGDEKTLDEVGRQFGVTRERVRQIQNNALKKLYGQIKKREAVQSPAGE